MSMRGGRATGFGAAVNSVADAMYMLGTVFAATDKNRLARHRFALPMRRSAVRNELF
jgi:hypothetical protein